MDPRVDLTHTNILLSGIGGADPARLTVGSAAWFKQVVDGDPAFEIDSRETPAAFAPIFSRGLGREVSCPTILF